MEKKEGFSCVQEDKFWIWRVNKEENLMIQELETCKEKEENLKRLHGSIEKAKEVASKIRKRPTEKATNT